MCKPVDLITLAEDLKKNLPNWSIKPASTEIFIHEDGSDNPITITIKLAPAALGEVFAEIDTGILVSRLGPKTMEYLHTQDCWFLSLQTYLSYLIPRTPVNTFTKQFSTTFQQVSRKIIKLEQVLVQADAKTKNIFK